MYNPNCGRCGGLNAWGYCSYTACRFPMWGTFIPGTAIASHLFYLTADNLPKKIEKVDITERTDISKMDAYDFLIARKRLCDSIKGDCSNCILYKFEGSQVCAYPHAIEGDYKDISFSAVAAVRAWNELHPVVSNGDKFKEIFGENIPNEIYGIDIDGSSWWNTEYKEPQK